MRVHFEISKRILAICNSWVNLRNLVKKLRTTNMRRQIVILIILFLIGSCSSKTETSNYQFSDSTVNLVKADGEKTGLRTQENFHDFVKSTKLPDNLAIDAGNVIHGDFNADGKDDFASLVTNQENGFQGVLIIHKGDKHEYLVFGAGQEIYGMTNLDWIDTFKTIPKGEIIAPTLVDSITGDIIGDDETKKFKLIGAGIYMHVDESEGGGILYWTGDKYNWYHIE
jgi:hypothetical protein